MTLSKTDKTPFAIMVEGNPYELFAPPDPEGDYYYDDPN